MDFGELVRIMAALRSEKGCPWDREQTRESLKPFLVEETYEVLEAIDGGRPEDIREELGDLLFQIIFQCRIAEEKGEFGVGDVIEKICGKMISRHPHVFGDADLKTSGEVLAHWEAQKQKEGKQRDSILDGVPATMPSLLRAHRLQDRAARVGFDWEKADDVIAKLEEELREFHQAYRTMDRDAIEDELGDVFFMLVNVARFTGVNPDDALRRTISKFISRFRYIEMAAADRGKRLPEMSLSEMDALWEEAKKKK